MNRLLPAILAFLVAGNVSLKGSETSATIVGPEPADYVWQRAETLPNLEGRLEEPMWEAATWTDLRHVVGNAAGEAPAARAAIIWDDVYLYVAFDVDALQIVAMSSTRDDDLQSEDCVALHLDPQGDGNSSSLAISAKGTLLDSNGALKSEGAIGGGNTMWNATSADFHVKPRDGGWQAEGRLRIDELDNGQPYPTEAR